MHVEIGPVSATSATAWIGYARAVLTGYGFPTPTTVDQQVGSDVAESFRHYLDEWDAIAAHGGEFKWVADVDLEVVEYLVHAFYRVAAQLADAAERRGSRLMPDEAGPFYASLVTGLLAGLRTAGEPAADFAEELESFWPGLDQRP